MEGLFLSINKIVQHFTGLETKRCTDCENFLSNLYFVLTMVHVEYCH